MPNLPPAIILPLSIAIARRHFTSKPKLPSLSHVPTKYRRQAIHQAKLALTEYLHSTRSLPFSYADHIVKNSQFAVSQIVSQLEFSAPNFPRTIRKFLRYHPVNEFEFFFESIGIDYAEINTVFFNPNVSFLSEVPRVFDAACLLCGFGFPWNKLGVLYRGDVSIFSKSPEFLRSRLEGFKGFGFGTLPVIGICLAFPHLLSGEDELGGAFLSDLRSIFIDSDLQSLVEGEVESWYEVCRKIRVFYELGVGISKVGKCKTLFLECQEEVLLEKIGFFSRLGVSKVDVGLLLLERSEVLSIDLITPTVSVLGILRHFGAEEEQIQLIERDYPYVIGRNKIIHLPRVLRAVELHEWFFNKIKNGHHHLLANYALSSPDESIDETYMTRFQEIKRTRTHAHEMGKLIFLHSVGFAENGYTVKILADIHGSSNELQERFDCLLAAGIGFSKLCKMLTVSPKILNQDAEILKEKVNFLRQEIGLSLDFLDTFPAYLRFDLEKRIKPRCRFHSWLEEQGLCARKYSLGSIIATSEKKFLARLRLIHPTAPKLWYEYVACKEEENGRQETSLVSQEL